MGIPKEPKPCFALKKTVKISVSAYESAGMSGSVVEWILSVFMHVCEGLESFFPFFSFSFLTVPVTLFPPLFYHLWSHPHPHPHSGPAALCLVKSFASPLPAPWRLFSLFWNISIRKMHFRIPHFDAFSHKNGQKLPLLAKKKLFALFSQKFTI